jgi:hypothetical protein
MALLLMEGLDIYADFDDITKTGWVRDNSAVILQTSTGRYGGGAVRFNSNLYGITRNIPVILYGNEAIICFAYYWGGSASSSAMVRFYSTTDLNLCDVGHDGTGQVVAAPQSGSSGASGTTDIPTATWCWVEIKVLFGTTASDGAINVKVDGTTVLSMSSVDTNYTGLGVNRVEITGGGHSVDFTYVDDIVIMNDTGSYMNDFIGDSLIETLTPNGDGTTVDWTASAGADYTCVDETPSAANDDTDYVYSATAGQEDRFTMTNLGSTPVTIHCVYPRARAKKTTAGLRTMRMLINSGGTETTGETLGLADGAYVWYPGEPYYVDPNTAAAWTESGVNAMQVGMEVVA